MNNNNLTRYRQRFTNYEKAIERMTKAVSQEKYNEIEEAGVIQIFEFTFELAWKTLKDFLNYEGYKTETPRDTIKQGFQLGYIKNGELWLDALEKRNVLSHAYDEKRASEAVQLIKKSYYQLLWDLYTFLQNKIKL